MLQHVTGVQPPAVGVCVRDTRRSVHCVHCLRSGCEAAKAAVKKTSQTAAPTDKCQLAAQAAWARGVEGQRRADLGSGCFLNPSSRRPPGPSILKDGTDYYMTFSSFDALPGLVVWHSRDWSTGNPSVRP